MKRLLPLLLATLSALSTPSAFADYCETMFRKKQIYYPQNKSKSLFTVIYSTEPNKKIQEIWIFLIGRNAKIHLFKKLATKLTHVMAIKKFIATINYSYISIFGKGIGLIKMVENGHFIINIRRSFQD